jgi:hypothetical protein
MICAQHDWWKSDPCPICTGSPGAPNFPKETGPQPVLWAKGALYGYCPKCGVPGIKRIDNKKDTCQKGHTYPSLEAKETP